MQGGFIFGGPKCLYFELFLKSAKYISYSVISLCWLNKIFAILLFYNLIKKYARKTNIGYDSQVGKAHVFETPDKYNLDYENVTFKTKDNVILSGWLIKGGNEKLIIQSHFGVQCSRRGFTN